MTITKKHLSDLIFEKFGETQKDSMAIVDAMFDSFRETLSTGKAIRLYRIGLFELRDKKERIGRNPQTGDRLPITGRRVVLFRPAADLRHHLRRSFQNKGAEYAKLPESEDGVLS